MIILLSQHHLHRSSFSYWAHYPYYQLHWHFFWYLMTLHLSNLQIHFHSFGHLLDLLHSQNQIQTLEVQGLFYHHDYLLPLKQTPLSFYQAFPYLIILHLFQYQRLNFWFPTFHHHFFALIYYLFRYLIHFLLLLALRPHLFTLRDHPLHFLQPLVLIYFTPF